MGVKIVKKLKDDRAGVYIEASFVLMLLVWIIALLVAILPVFAYINKVNVYANNVARIISVEGGLTSGAMSRIEEYKYKMQLENLYLDYSGSEFFDGYKVQLNDSIVVETATSYNVKIIGIPVNIPIEAKAMSRSEVYYK